MAWLRAHFGENFWDKHMWPPRSPDLNPLDARAGGMVGAKLCSRGIPNTYEEVDQAIRRGAEEVLTPDYVINICDPDREKKML